MNYNICRVNSFFISALMRGWVDELFTGKRGLDEPWLLAPPISLPLSQQNRWSSWCCFAPVVQLQMGFQHFSCLFLKHVSSPTGRWWGRGFSGAHRDIFPQQARPQSGEKPARWLCCPMPRICARTFSKRGSWKPESPLWTWCPHMCWIRWWTVRHNIQTILISFTFLENINVQFKIYTCVKSILLKICFHNYVKLHMHWRWVERCWCTDAVPLSSTCLRADAASPPLVPTYPSSLCSPCLSSMVVYGSVDTAAQCLLTLVPDPEGCPVLCLKHSSQHLFAGLQSGTVVVYARSNSGKAPRSSLSVEAGLFQLFSVFRLKSALQILFNTTHLVTFHTILV